MRLSLSELRSMIRKIVCEEVEATVERRIDEVVARRIGEVYIRSMVEHVAAGGRHVETEEVRTIESRSKMVEAVARNSGRTHTPKSLSTSNPLLSPTNPLSEIYEGVAPLDEHVEDEGVPLDSLDMEHIRLLNRRLIEG